MENKILNELLLNGIGYSTKKKTETYKETGKVIFYNREPLDVLKYKELEYVNGQLKTVGCYLVIVDRKILRLSKNNPEYKSYLLESKQLIKISEEEFNSDYYITSDKRIIASF
jgi:hypothetical protein